MLEQEIRNKLYKIWAGIKQRCNNPNQPSYKHYGARGIKMCEEWSKSFDKFYIWAKENGYKEKLSIDRINVDKGYSPENCRWTDRKTQMNNRTNSCLINYNGETKSITEWARETRIKSKYYSTKIGYGMRIR